MNELSFATLLTAAGAGIAAGLVTTFVEVLKTAWGHEGMPASGAALAFGLSAVLYLLAGIATGVASLDDGLVVFVAWLTCATSAVGVHSTITHVAARGE
jgi:hypothetical protein